MAARKREGSVAQAATPEVSSKNEKITALITGALRMQSNAEIQPTAQVKKVTRAQTDITAPAAEATESVNILKTDFVSLGFSSSHSGRMLDFLS